ncbi:hypothetical protein GCM10023187_16720 [Nibrella viscosa]|uniref:chitinase n=1 Tax=Nibrella viscosa TaxID=1084524 RepID=A0ABP8K7P0_9BACT
MTYHSALVTIAVLVGLVLPYPAYPAGPITVIGYYAGSPEKVSTIDAGKLTHVIYSFGHLSGNRFYIGKGKPAETVRNLVALKKKHPKLKVMLSLGGWGGCATCSKVFASADNRKAFARSVREVLDAFKADGIDLDWEYPVVKGFPGHPYGPEDKPNFTELIRELRRELGPNRELSFAAGAFQKYLDEAVDWRAVMPLVNRVNLMTYDLVHGNSPTTGHHAALYSTPWQPESTDNAVQTLLRLGIPADKLVIGAAFYTRIWENVPAGYNGRYQPGKFKGSTAYRNVQRDFGPQTGYKAYWDDTAKAPYFYHASRKRYVSYDNPRSVEMKTRYAVEKGLNGIMFWALLHDKPNGLLAVIDRVKQSVKK